jgi:hypothetical protein
VVHSDEQWELIEPLLPNSGRVVRPAARRASEQVTPRRRPLCPREARRPNKAGKATDGGVGSDTARAHLPITFDATEQRTHD